MPSLRMKSGNWISRRFLKGLLNSNYDPASFRSKLPKLSPRILPKGEIVQLSNAYIESWGDNGEGRKVLYVPGGGFCFGPNNEHRFFVDFIASKTGSNRNLLFYRLAPENQFPCAFNDTLEAIRRLSETAREVVILSDSAGGALVASALMRLRDSSEPCFRKVKALVFLSPFFDLALSGESLISNSTLDPLFGVEALIHKVHHYLGDVNPTNPNVSPLWGDLSNLPPSLFIVGSTEVLLSDTKRFVSKGSVAECDFRLSVHDEASHVFPLKRGLPEAKTARKEVISFLRGVLD